MPVVHKSFLNSPSTSEYGKKRRSIHSMSPVVGIIFVSSLFGLYGIIYLIDGILPKPLYINDEKNSPDSFIAERARNDLKLLTDIGPRVVGSDENEILAVEFLIKKIQLIQQQAHSNQRIELDIQTVTGSYYLGSPYNVINAYGAVQNVVVKLHSKNDSLHSLLVNAHFDSIAFSPGGSDDGIMCVTMLESLYKLSKSSEPPEHGIIFLFNGAEETPLHASHGFISQHRWAKEVQVVINLEAAGAGGKEILFQAGPGQPWLLKYYQKVPHPNGQAAGEELFQSDTIPSGTDFKIFQTFGNMIGLDIAFIRNGYRYHTKFDDFSNIPLGSYQHVGDNVLSLIRNLANAPELANPKGQLPQEFVFYDFFGLFMISYSKTVAIAVNVLTSILSIIVAIKTFRDFGLRFDRSSKIYVSFTLAAILIGWILAGIYIIIIALIIDATGFSLSWYRNPWIILGLYVLPAFNCCCSSLVFLNSIFEKKNISISAQAQVQTHLLRLIWMVLLLVGTCIGIRAVYAILIPVLFHMLTGAVIQISCLQYSVRKWQIVYIFGTIIPTMFLMKSAREVFALFVPMCGRIGSDRNAEIYIGFLALAMTILITSFYTPLITLLHQPILVLKVFQGISLLFLIFVFTPLGFPYTGNSTSPAPQRFWIYHLQRDFRNDTNEVYKSDSGYFLLNMDRNSPNSVKKYVENINTRILIKEDCEKHLLCGFPISTTRVIAILTESTWIPADLPVINKPISLKLNLKENRGNSTMRFNFTAEGPSQFTLYISPRPGTRLTGTNLVDHLPSKPLLWYKHPYYVINYIWGTKSTPLSFSLDIEVPSNWSKPILDISLAGSYKHAKTNIKTESFKRFLNGLPDWADVIAWIGMYQSWVY